MTCGCKPSAVPAEIRATRAGMCVACPSRRVRPDGTTDGCSMAPVTLLTVGGVAATCPRGRWPDAEGFVRWLGLRWFGVPEPLRWVVDWRIRREARLPGCGCVAGLKERWGRLLGPVFARVPRLRRWAVTTWARLEAP